MQILKRFYSYNHQNVKKLNILTITFSPALLKGTGLRAVRTEPSFSATRELPVPQRAAPHGAPFRTAPPHAASGRQPAWLGSRTVPASPLRAVPPRPAARRARLSPPRPAERSGPRRTGLPGRARRPAAGEERQRQPGPPRGLLRCAAAGTPTPARPPTCGSGSALRRRQEATPSAEPRTTLPSEPRGAAPRCRTGPRLLEAGRRCGAPFAFCRRFATSATTQSRAL